MSATIDVKGEKYYKLTAISKTDKKVKNSYVWVWKCDCGNTCEAPVNQVKYGSIKSCGCAKLHPAKRKTKQRDLTGKIIGKLIVLKPLGKINNNTHYSSLVRCDCGCEFTAFDTVLVNNQITCCPRCAHSTHGLTHNPLFSVWQSMLSRCFNENNKSYKNYGERGITVCEEWRKDFQSFYDWAIRNRYDKGLQIDRIDVNGNYEPDNCRFVTQIENARNKRNTISIDYEGSILTIGEIAEITGIRATTIYERIYKYLWSEYDATHIPVRETRNYKTDRMRKTTLTNLVSNEIRDFSSASQASLFLEKNEAFLLGKSYKKGNVFTYEDWLVEIT